MSEHSSPHETRSSGVDYSSDMKRRRFGDWLGVFSGNRQPVSKVERWLLRRLLHALGDPPVVIVLPDGEDILPVSTPATSRVTLHDRRTLWKLLLDPAFQFPEGYATGAIDVEGVDSLLSGAFECLNQGTLFGKHADRFFRQLWKPQDNTASQSRDNIHHHYDIGNDFYRLWLDRQMVYTCAYFANSSFTLEQAQVAKMDYVCRKLQLRPGMMVYEAGCGWGALALHMARHYGVKVRAVNISCEQIAYARDQARQHQLEGCVEFIEDDWRNISGKCDAFVSVGMLEHVGLKNYRRLSDTMHACLTSEGIGLIHSIGQNFPRPLNPWIERRIFPGAYPPSLREMMDIFEPNGFSVLDVENLRLHYAETLRHWLERFERCSDMVRAQFDERFVRTWRFYLTTSAVAFETGGLQLFQVVFNRGTNNAVPRSRAFLYAQQSRQSHCSNEHSSTPNRLKIFQDRELADGCSKK